MVPRWASSQVGDALEDTRVVFVMDPRQAGKSTLVNGMVAMRAWRSALTFDDETTRQQAAIDP
jgi:predicted AAA+ superfamily ATPase